MLTDGDGMLTESARVVVGRLFTAHGVLTANGMLKDGDEMVMSLVKLFTDNGGDAAAIAAACGCSTESLRGNPPADADDFAHMYLAGAFPPRLVAPSAPSERRRPRNVAP